MQRIIEKQHHVVITDRMWARLLSSTHQPSFMNPKDVIEDEKEEELLTQIVNEDKKEEELPTKIPDISTEDNLLKKEIAA